MSVVSTLLAINFLFTANALSERSFSASKKKWMNNLMVMSVYKEEQDSSDRIDVANDFVAGNPHRLSKFGPFYRILDDNKNLKTGFKMA